MERCEFLLRAFTAPSGLTEISSPNDFYMDLELNFRIIDRVLEEISPVQPISTEPIPARADISASAETENSIPSFLLRRQQEG